MVEVILQIIEGLHKMLGIGQGGVSFICDHANLHYHLRFWARLPSDISVEVKIPASLWKWLVNRTLSPGWLVRRSAYCGCIGIHVAVVASDEQRRLARYTASHEDCIETDLHL